MKIDIWSDIRCPFCYIGKRKFENALEKFPHNNSVEVNWHSFELDPTLKTNTEINATEHLASIKGIPKSRAEEMNQYVAKMAEEVGLRFTFDKNVVANSFKAHRLIQLAKTKGLSDAAEEALFKAHFTEGKNIDDKKTLEDIALGIGLRSEEVNKFLNSDSFTKEVRQDEMQAQTFGIHGVPFFIFNDKYAVSGAQPSETFLEVMNKTWEEFKEKPLIIQEGESCSVEGNCN